ncbi:hypothetical protein UPYG_G00249480 [Umbra pygmaea]|uniref:Myelin regulatory factor-like protein n=1 Tax=Umbra pygmaea TaxID=75934 RepID=A0ABD0W8S8_UMBPY
MEPTGGTRLPVEVLGENEALQQFFDGCQDMGEGLESSVVDTSILEQYLSNEMDPAIMLPESPPYSGSEPCSPPQIPAVGYSSHWSNDQVNQEVHRGGSKLAASSRQYKELAMQLPQHTVLPYQELTNSYIKAGLSPSPQTHDSPLRRTLYLSPGESFVQVNTPPTPPVHLDVLQQHPSMGPGDRYSRINATLPLAPGIHPGQAPRSAFVSGLQSASNLHPSLGPHTTKGPPLGNCVEPDQASGLGLPPNTASHLPVPGFPTEPGYPYLPNSAGQETGPILAECKKRRRTESFEKTNHFVPVPITLGSEVGGGGGEIPCYDSDGAPAGSSGVGTHQLLTWERYQPDQWSTVYDSNYESLPSPGYHVDTDKGFIFSTADEAFVCQKKNHFQVTVHIGMAGHPHYVKTPQGPAPIENFHVKVFGVKLETQSNEVTIEQSQSDRSKKPFLPVDVNLPGDQITKVTLGRLHFSETTANNMRKRGKPNPDQRYFMMVVGLYAKTKEESYLLVAYMSEKIIVRASNPGQFENDSEVAWQRGQAPDTVVCQGRVGINTDSPDEALVVCGNAKVMGQVMHPSDYRAKHNIQEVDSTEQLKRISQMRIVEYDYKPEFASKMGIDHVHETGIIAQEVKELLPAAVKEVGDITCSDGERIENFLMVDKEQIFMENVGAVKQLCKLTDNLENRIQELEVWNTRLARLKNLGSLRSSGGSVKGKPNSHNWVPPQLSPPQKPTALQSAMAKFQAKYNHCLKHRLFQVSIIFLVAIMAFCSIAIVGLYILTLRDTVGTGPPGTSNNTVSPLQTTTFRPTLVSPTAPPGPWPPDVDFCSLLYCKEVFCCPITDSVDNPTNNYSALVSSLLLPRLTRGSPIDRRKDKFSKKILGVGDWTNTTIKSFVIKETQQIIDYEYCEMGNCGSGNYSFQIPVSKFVPTNMPITVQMKTSDLLVVHLCHYEMSECAALLDHDQTSEEYAFINTQGYDHEWHLTVARYYRSSYHFRSAVAGQADCNTDRGFMGALFTDYHFQFYRRCE